LCLLTISVSAKVICNKFDLNSDINNNIVKFWLSTDLPDDTNVMTSVCRLYWKKNDKETYILCYYQSKSTVNELKNPVVVEINDSVFKKKLEEKQQFLAKIGEPFEVSKISDEVKIGLTVPINQKNTNFGLRNANLEGSKVINDKGLNIIKIEKTFKIKMSDSDVKTISNKKQYSLDPYNLNLDIPYRISKRTPISEELDQKDSIRAIQELKYLSSGSIIRIFRMEKKGNFQYYYVIATAGTNSKHQLKGWINSVALLGQDLKVVD
jgi:hypothetical protein